MDDLNRRIKGLDVWLDERARRDERVLRLQTHPCIGLPTSLALVHMLEPMSRFGGGRKVAAYVNLTPMEYSSGERPRFGELSSLPLPHGPRLFCAKPLMAEVTEKIKESLWSAIRSFEEGAMLTRQMAGHSYEGESDGAHEELLRRAQEIMRRVNLMKQAVTGNGKPRRSARREQWVNVNASGFEGESSRIGLRSHGSSCRY